MEQKRATSDEQSDVKYYLPGMPRMTSEVGRVERFLTQLFRQRGRYRHVVRRKSQ